VFSYSVSGNHPAIYASEGDVTLLWRALVVPSLYGKHQTAFTVTKVTTTSRLLKQSTAASPVNTR